MPYEAEAGRIPSMSDQGVSEMLAREIPRHYRKLQEQLHRWVDPLPDAQIWVCPYTYGNSVGHLLLHVTGNLSYYIGTEIAKSGYVRNRDLEFTSTERLPKPVLLRNFDAAIEMACRTAAAQQPQEWGTPYTARGEEDASTRFMIFLRCASHLQEHIGQIVYLSKEIAKHR